MNESTKDNGLISVISSVASVLLVAMVIAMAWESGIAESKATMAKLLSILAVIAGGGGIWFGIQGVRKGQKKAMAKLGLALGGLSTFIGLALVAA